MAVAFRALPAGVKASKPTAVVFTPWAAEPAPTVVAPACPANALTDRGLIARWIGEGTIANGHRVNSIRVGTISHSK